MRRSWALLVWLVVVWMALWEEISAANLLGGVAAAAILLGLFPRRTRERTGRVRPLAAARFLLYFLRKLVEASFVLSWEVVTPRNRINEGVVAIPIQGVSDALVTVVANAISLVPGTLTLEVDDHPAVLYVHVLHLRDVEEVRREVQHLELLAIHAFASDEALRSARRALAASPGRPAPAPAGRRPAETTRRKP